MNRKELALLAVSTVATLLLALGLLRWLAPSLLGGPRDLQLVRTREEVPPFFEGVFRPEHFQTPDFLLKDPRTVNRPRPFLGEIPAQAVGPHDLLGFRNRAVPAVADTVVIGDSQTYGVNVLLEDNWPSVLARGKGTGSVYSMAIGSWGAVQYADMFHNAAAFRPRVVVVAFYSGNDALDSFGLAYGSEQWRTLRPDPGLDAGAAPAVAFPPPESEWWTVPLGGRPMTFAPKLRLVNNQPGPAVDAGYGVMHLAAVTMAQIAQRGGFAAIMTVVPTKELVYARRIAAEGIEPPPEYRALVEVEARRIRELCGAIAALPATSCVDLVAPLQAAALTEPDLYPPDVNGHPLAAGYRVIGEALAPAVAAQVPPPPSGWVALAQDTEGRELTPFLVRDGVAWMFPDPGLAVRNGWRDPEARVVDARDLAGLPKRAVPGVDPARFGPRPGGG